MDGSIASIEARIMKYRKNGFPNVHVSDTGDGFYRNPILHTDYSDPDIIRVGSDFYMTASSFSNVPGLPVLHSRDLVNWKLINYALRELPFPGYDAPLYGCGVWAPSMRFHDNWFYIYVGFPDEGIVMVRSRDPGGSWEQPRVLKHTRGWIDTCPFWDDDGNAYLINAFAKSRIGFKSLLAITKMSPDGCELTDEFRIVYDGNERNPTIEGPKLYKRNGFYYILAPAGGVANGWQLALRSRNIYGSYDGKIVLSTGSTGINGPHQGGLVELDNGEAWFAHFQDAGPYGRIVHLQPVSWVDDWPIMGNSGEPVLIHKKPDVKTKDREYHGSIESLGISASQASDDFNNVIGLKWQWNANPKPGWYTVEGSILNLNAVCPSAGGSAQLYSAPNLLTMKFPAREFSAVAKMVFHGAYMGERAGLAVLGERYAAVELVRRGVLTESYTVSVLEGRSFDGWAAAEVVTDAKQAKSGAIYLKVDIDAQAGCIFSYSYDGESFTVIGEGFTACRNRWVGAKLALYCIGTGEPKPGFCEFDWFLVEEKWG